MEDQPKNEYTTIRVKRDTADLIKHIQLYASVRAGISMSIDNTLHYFLSEYLDEYLEDGETEH